MFFISRSSEEAQTLTSLWNSNSGHWCLIFAVFVFLKLLSSASMLWQHPPATSTEPPCGGWSHQHLNSSLHISTHTWQQVISAPSSPVLFIITTSSRSDDKNLERDKRSLEFFTLISWLLCHCTTCHIISWWKSDLKVKPQGLPSSLSFLVPIPLLWTYSLLVAYSLPTFQLVASSRSICF